MHTAGEIVELFKKFPKDMPVLMAIRHKPDEDTEATYFDVSFINEPGNYPHVLIQGYSFRDLD